MLTPDSSRFWPREGYEAGKGQPSYDKQFVRDWLKQNPDSDYNLPEEVIDKTVAKYKEAYGDTPNQFAADTYDAIYIMKAAAEKAGVTADMNVSDICDAMKTAMTEISYDGLTGEGMTWTADGEPDKAPKAVVIKDGAYTAM